VAAAPAIAAAELAVATALVLPASRTSGALGAVALLAVYSIAIGVNLGRGRRTIDCGCGALGARQPISEWLVVRNAALAGAALLTLRTPGPRTLVWIDWLSVAGGVAVVTCAWTASQLLFAAALRPRPLAAAPRAGALP
jgi:hypothetical protein